MLIIRFLLLLMLAAPAWAALDGRKQELEGVRERIAKLKQGNPNGTSPKSTAACVN